MRTTLQTELIAGVLMILGDAVLRLLSLASWPTSFQQWEGILIKPEGVNLIVIVIILAVLVNLPNYGSSAWTGLTAVVLALSTTFAHRLILGSAFPAMAMLMTGIIFAALALLSLTLAHQWSQGKAV
ncbi:hypothetical protein HZA86_03850 [Candidatus Uhrbacteria bacterium]|nr:hypothetical protein [Candidatus Uhrbacteria bacterium]